MQWHFPFGEKGWFEFQETSQFTNGTAFPEIYEHKRARPNSQQFQVFPGIFDLNSVAGIVRIVESSAFF